MPNENKNQPRIDDLMAQLAAESIRADNAEQELSQVKTRLDKAQGELDERNAQVRDLEKERADAASESPQKLKEQIKMLVNKISSLEKERNDALSPERVREAVKNRVRIERAAAAVMNRETFDELGDRDLMVEVVEKLRGQRLDASYSDDYVRARFDAAIEGYQDGAAALERIREATRNREPAESRNDARSAHAAMVERNRNAWKPQAQEAK